MSTPEGLTSAVTNDFNVKLTANIELTTTLNIATTTGVLDLNGHVLSLKSGTNGSVIKVDSNGNLTLTDNSSGKTGRVAGGKGTSSGSSLYGGGVFVNGGTFTMSGGSICDNTAQWGGGVCVREGGMFAMSGGTISGNKATTTSGGSGGGGVDVENGTFTMSGGSIITSNDAGSGGGVYVNDSGTFNMTGGSITSNDAGSGGGGVYGKKESTFRVSGAPVIKNNKKGSDGNNVYLKSNAKITIDDALTSGAEIWVTPDTAPTSNSSVAITAESSGNYSSYFKSDNSAYGVANTGTGDKQVVKIGILYTVTFEANGHGTAPDSQSVLGGEKVTEPETPTAEGYTFGGWYENPECTGNAWNFETGTITGNKTLYAKWEDAEPTITVEQTTENPVYGDAATVTYDVTISDFASAPTLVFAWNGGSSPQDVSYTVPTFTTGTETKQLTITTDGTTPANLDGYGFTLSDNAGHSAGGKLVVEKKSITIDGTDPAAITKTYDGSTNLPAGVTLTSSGVKDGDTVSFTFTGSYDNKNVGDSKTVNFTGIAFDGTAGDNGNYTLSGTTYSSTNGKIEAKSIEGVTVTLKDETWIYDATAKQPTVISVVDGTVTLTKDTDYSVSYGTNIDAGDDAGEVYITGKGNYDKNTKATKKFTISPSDVTVSWQETTTFPFNDQEHEITATVTGVYNSEVTETYADNKKTAVGNYTANLTLAVASAAKPTNYTLPNPNPATCVWSITAGASHTVTYKIGDETYGTPESHNYGDIVTVWAKGTKTGYTVGDWTSTDVTIVNGEFTMADKDVTITATATAEQYTITYKDQGDATYSGNNKSSLVETHTYGTDTTLASGTKTGYTFGGWFKEQNCSGTAVTAIGATEYTADFTLYAKWTANIPPYTITFNGNGGTVTPSTLVVYYGETVDLRAVTVGERSGYTHSGWALSSNGPAVYAATQSVKDLGNITLYAVWTPVEKQHTLTVKVTHGNELVSGAAVTLRQGNVQWGDIKTTGSDGTATFDNVPEGVYTIEASKDGKTKTKSVTISGDSEREINLPDKNVSSKVDVKSGAGTPAVAVEGADTVAEICSPGSGESITVTVIVESKTDGSAPDVQKEIDEIKKITPAGSKVEYLGITIEKKTEKAGERPTTEPIKDTGTNVLEFLIPYDFTNKTEIKLYRCHEDEGGRLVATPLTKLLEKPANLQDGTYWLDWDNSLIHLHSKKFSTYSVGYRPDSPKPSGGGSQGSSTWIQTIPSVPGDNTVATDVTYQYTGQKFIPLSAANLEQISAADPAAAAAVEMVLQTASAAGIPLTNSKGAKAIVNTAESVPGTQTETFSQVIEVTSADGSKVTSVPFKVRLSDLAAKSLTTDDVTLYHYLEEYGLWIPLETGLVSTDDVYAYYEAATDGASPFGVLLKKLDAPEVKPVPTQTGASPAPFAGVIAALGAAAVVFGLRRR